MNKKIKYQYPILFNILIERSNNERLFMQISIIISQLKAMILNWVSHWDAKLS